MKLLLYQLIQFFNVVSNKSCLNTVKHVPHIVILTYNICKRLELFIILYIYISYSLIKLCKHIL